VDERQKTPLTLLALVTYPKLAENLSVPAYYK
jgi:hypothetical protein